LEQGTPADQPGQPAAGNPWRTIARFSLPSEPGKERLAADHVTQAVQELNLSHAYLQRLKTAVAEGSLNAMEHGNHFQPEKPVDIEVQVSAEALRVLITDQNTEGMPSDLPTPDLEAKLSGQQSPRGWGLFLIRKMVDEMRVTSVPGHNIMELILRFE
jgi:anti-sigma regulatory factor (Ser/Thr protein kinase)